MKKQLGKQLTAWALLLIYFISNSPSFFYHHHTEPVAYEKATDCEKAIYYADKAAACNHQTHIATAIEKCSLCDIHALSPHAAQPIITSCVSNEVVKGYVVKSSAYFSQSISTSSNRGPPSISFFIG